jgi:uncharacterized protein YraI
VRRKMMVLTVAALMAAMMVSAGPAKADVNISGGGTSFGNGGSINRGLGVVHINGSAGAIDGFDVDDLDDGAIIFSVGNGSIDFD